MTESYPTWHALVYEMWAFSSLHPWWLALYISTMLALLRVAIRTRRAE